LVAVTAAVAIVKGEGNGDDRLASAVCMATITEACIYDIKVSNDPSKAREKNEVQTDVEPSTLKHGCEKKKKEMYKIKKGRTLPPAWVTRLSRLAGIGVASATKREAKRAKNTKATRDMTW
jgi:hypothetical protein